MAKQQPPGNSIPESYDELPEEKGIEEEGLFDIINPFKKALIKKIQIEAPESQSAQLMAEAANLVIPDSPLGMGAASLKALKMSPQMREMVQSVKFPKASEGAKVFGQQPKAATLQKFEEMIPTVQAEKRKAAIEALRAKGPPSEVKKPIKQTGLSSTGDEFEVE